MGQAPSCQVNGGINIFVALRKHWQFVARASILRAGWWTLWSRWRPSSHMVLGCSRDVRGFWAYSGWWKNTPEKYWSSHLGWWNSQLNGKIINMFCSSHHHAKISSSDLNFVRCPDRFFQASARGSAHSRYTGLPFKTEPKMPSQAPLAADTAFKYLTWMIPSGNDLT